MMRFVIVGKNVHPYEEHMKGQVITVFPVREEPELHEGDRLFFLERASRRLGVFKVKQETDYGYVIRNEANPKLELTIPLRFNEDLRTMDMPLYRVI